MDELLKLRNEIDAIDEEIVALFEKRMAVSEDVAEYKRKIGKPVLDSGREAQKIQKVRALAHSEFNAQGVNALFNQIMTISRMRQYMLLSGQSDEYSGFTSVLGIKALPGADTADFFRMPYTKGTKVAYSGVEGAYAHQAMLGYFGDSADAFNVPSFKACMDAIKDGEARYGVLPAENSSTGIITDVYDLLSQYDNYIVGEYVVRVSHALLACPGASLSDIKTVYSHPQGLLQCRGFLADKDWQQISLSNTAVAARKVKEDMDPSQAAIASETAARVHGLSVLARGINDLKNNSTRFIIIENRREYMKNAMVIRSNMLSQMVLGMANAEEIRERLAAQGIFFDSRAYRTAILDIDIYSDIYQPSPEEKQEVWLRFLENGGLICPDPKKVPRLYPNDESIYEKLKETIKNQNKNNWYAHYNLALYYFQKGKYKKAYKEFEASASIKKNAWAYHGMASSAVMRGQNKKARKAMKKGIRLRGEDLSYLKEGFRILHMSGGYEEICRIYDSLKKRFQKDGRLCFYYIRALHETGRSEKARRLLNADGGLEVSDVREGELSLGELWLELERMAGQEPDQVPYRFDFHSA